MIVAGFGFRGAATAQSLADAYAKASGAQGAAQVAATISDKAPGVFETFAAEQGLTLKTVPEADLVAQQTTTQSFTSLAARGTGSVAEAAALAAAGQGARLIKARVISDDGCATCALAEVPR